MQGIILNPNQHLSPVVELLPVGTEHLTYFSYASWCLTPLILRLQASLAEHQATRVLEVRCCFPSKTRPLAYCVVFQLQFKTLHYLNFIASAV